MHLKRRWKRLKDKDVNEKLIKLYEKMLIKLKQKACTYGDILKDFFTESIEILKDDPIETQIKKKSTKTSGDYK